MRGRSGEAKIISRAQAAVRAPLQRLENRVLESAQEDAAMLTLPPDSPVLVQLADEIATLSAHLDAATARLLTLIREFDALGGWGSHGCRSCAHWLSWRCGMDLGAARERVRVARALVPCRG
jgi:hypothetical protein